MTSHQLRLHDSATNTTRAFTPLRDGHVGIYLCGLTVQSEPHVGHLRSGINFDVLRRWLTATGHAVTFIRNVTDIDDKILAKAHEQGLAWYELAYRMHRELDRAYALLNVTPPTYEPAATGHIPEMIDLIGTLIDRGHAYAAADGSGDVYFSVASWPNYGELTRQGQGHPDGTEDTAPEAGSKRDPRDFALWKGRKAAEPVTASWTSPWGPGRPGWHIECSAMAGKYLGDAFDIHAGGLDLRFPHHENEQAQSRAAGHGFAAYWMHNAWITAAGKKMAKSLGNYLSIPNVLTRVRPIELRYYMVAAHYRSHVEFSFDALEEAAVSFRRIEAFLDRTPAAAPGLLPEKFVAAMNDDLGTPAAVAVIHDHVRDGNKALAAGQDASVIAGAVRAMLDVLGLDPDTYPIGTGDTGTGAAAAHDPALAVLMEHLLAQRAEARTARDFATADRIRDVIAQAGITVEDTAHGPRWSR